jgi:hypothetical protein
VELLFTHETVAEERNVTCDINCVCVCVCVCNRSQSSHEEDNQIVMNVLKVQQYLLNTAYFDTNARPVKTFIQLHHGESQQYLKVCMCIQHILATWPVALLFMWRCWAWSTRG